MTTEPKEASHAALDDWLQLRLTTLQVDGRCRDRAVTRTGPGWCDRNGQRLLNFASNDYLGLSHDERVCEAFAQVAREGAGSGASALVTGRSEWHERLETTIANFEGTEAAMLFPSGYAANVGTLAALLAPEDVVFSDRLNHASLIDGCRLSGAQLRVYRHDELEKLDERLGRQTVTRRFIVTDGVFSMDGTIAPLLELCELAEKHDAILIVDEAHGTGVVGHNGRGASEFAGVENRIPVRLGTLSKAIGTLGGFVAGSQQLIDYLWNSARSQFFSTALPPAVCAAAVAAFEVLQVEPERRERVQGHARLLRELLPSDRNSQCDNPIVPIVPVVIGSESAAVTAAKRVEDDGFLVACVRPPTVPNNTSRLRVSLSADHSEDDVRRLTESITRAVQSVQGGTQ